MKKRLQFYTIVWAILLVTFNAVALTMILVVKAEATNQWVKYVLVTAAFAGHLACTWLTYRDIDAKKRFYLLAHGEALVKAIYGGIAAILIIGILCVVIPILPHWIVAILSLIVLAFVVSFILRANVAVAYVSAVDEKVEKKTAFIYSMRAEAEGLLATASSDEAKALCKKLKEAFQYSDPMSAEALAEVEADIEAHVKVLGRAVRDNAVDVAQDEQKTILVLLAQRNAKCKVLK